MDIVKTDPSKIYKTLPTPIEFMFNNHYHDKIKELYNKKITNEDILDYYGYNKPSDAPNAQFLDEDAYTKMQESMIHQYLDARAKGRRLKKCINDIDLNEYLNNLDKDLSSINFSKIIENPPIIIFKPVHNLNTRPEKHLYTDSKEKDDFKAFIKIIQSLKRQFIQHPEYRDIDPLDLYIYSYSPRLHFRTAWSENIPGYDYISIGTPKPIGDSFNAFYIMLEKIYNHINDNYGISREQFDQIVSTIYMHPHLTDMENITIDKDTVPPPRTRKEELKNIINNYDRLDPLRKSVLEPEIEGYKTELQELEAKEDSGIEDPEI